MSYDPKMAPREERVAWQKHFAAAAFNESWDLVDKVDRTPDDHAELLAAAFASRWHWGKVGTLENLILGDHQVAKAASAAGMPDVAVHYSQRVLDGAEVEGWTGWRLALAYEGMARALNVAGDTAGRDEWLGKARQTLEFIDDPEDRSVVEGQLREIPGWE